MSIFREYDFEVVSRPGPQNATANYLSRTVGRNGSVLTMELDPELNSVAEYLSRGSINRTFSIVALAVKISAKNYYMHEGGLY